MAEQEWSDVKEALDEELPSFTDSDDDSISNEVSLFVKEKKEKKERTYLKIKKNKKDKTKHYGNARSSMGEDFMGVFVVFIVVISFFCSPCHRTSARSSRLAAAMVAPRRQSRGRTSWV